MPNSPAMKRRMRCGFWLVMWSVRLPPRWSATHARGSIGAPAVRWLTIRRSMTISDSAQAVSMSPPPIVHSCVWLVPRSSCTSGEAASSAFSGSTTTGSGSYSTKTCSAASRTPYLSEPSTIATACPTYFTVSLASGSVSGDLISTPGGTHAIGSGDSSCTSSAVNTPWTPGAPLAPSVSIETIRACASVDRTTAMCSMPASTMSST